MTRRQRSRFPRLWPRARQRAFRALRAAPPLLRLVVAAIVAAGLWAAANWIYQAVHKPTELLFPVSGTLTKTPSQTWRDYEPQFRKYATAVLTPELLAALAQGRERGQPPRADVLAMASDMASLRTVPTGFQCGRHVPDYRCDVRPDEARVPV